MALTPDICLRDFASNSPCRNCRNLEVLSLTCSLNGIMLVDADF
jgi:hypothetical protein